MIEKNFTKKKEKWIFRVIYERMKKKTETFKHAWTLKIKSQTQKKYMVQAAWI